MGSLRHQHLRRAQSDRTRPGHRGHRVRSGAFRSPDAGDAAAAGRVKSRSHLAPGAVNAGTGCDPGLEHLLKILTAAGFYLLTRIVPHDDHEDVLKARGARLDPQARRARNDAMREFADEMREAMAHSRPLIPK